MSRVVGLVVVAIVGLAACGSAPDGSPAPATALGTAPVLTDGAGSGACPITAAPGASDEPPRDGAELDTTDMGGGRWSLCLSMPTPVGLEGRAWCTWDEARSRPVEVAGLPTPVGSVDYDAYVNLERGEVGASLTDRGAVEGSVATYQERGPLTIETTDDGRDGVVLVDVVLVVDPESGPPPGAPQALGGLMRWTCGPPPPPR
jgi:hypothetical protein